MKLQEELKTMRNRYTLMREEVDVQKRKNENREQETFSSRYELVGLQGELDQLRQQMNAVEEERDALRTSLKQEEVARIAAEGKMPLPTSQKTDEVASPNKRRRESVKENVDPEAIEVEEEDETEILKGELRMERRMRTNAEKLIDFMKMECQFQCCACRLAEQAGTRYIHDGSLEKQMEKVWASIPKGIVNNGRPSIPPPEPSVSTPSSPLRRPSLNGQTTEMLINFSPSTTTFFKTSSPAKQDVPKLPQLLPEDPNEEDIVSIMYDVETPPAPPPEAPPHPTPTASSYFPPQEQILHTQRTPRLLPHPPPTLHSSTARHTSTIRSVTYPVHTTTTSIPLAPIPVSPERTITRDEALEQIRQRRGRARSIAAANGTPRKGLVMGTPDARRNASAPARD